MKKLLALALLLWAGPALAQVGPPNQILCNATAVMEVGPTTQTQLVAGAVGKAIFVCGWHITNTAAAGTFSIQSGTTSGTPCAAGTKKMTPTQNVTSSAPSGDHVEFTHWSSNAGDNLCVTPSAATISAMVWFYQG
jgi:hypothetical protein